MASQVNASKHLRKKYQFYVSLPENRKRGKISSGFYGPEK